MTSTPRRGATRTSASRWGSAATRSSSARPPDTSRTPSMRARLHLHVRCAPLHGPRPRRLTTRTARGRLPWRVGEPSTATHLRRRTRRHVGGNARRAPSTRSAGRRTTDASRVGEADGRRRRQADQFGSAVAIDGATLVAAFGGALRPSSSSRSAPAATSAAPSASRRSRCSRAGRAREEGNGHVPALESSEREAEAGEGARPRFATFRKLKVRGKRGPIWSASSSGASASARAATGSPPCRPAAPLTPQDSRSRGRHDDRHRVHSLRDARGRDRAPRARAERLDLGRVQVAEGWSHDATIVLAEIAASRRGSGSVRVSSRCGGGRRRASRWPPRVCSAPPAGASRSGWAPAARR